MTRSAYHGDVRSAEHFALHLAKYAGELASACEKMGHETEREEGQRLLIAWMEKRPAQVIRTLSLLCETTGLYPVNAPMLKEGAP